MLAMKNTDILKEAEEYCEAANISRSTLAVRALNNSRFFERVERQQSQLRKAKERLRKYMVQNPAQKQTEAS